jgi:hypothetical protein
MKEIPTDLIEDLRRTAKVGRQVLNDADHVARQLSGRSTAQLITILGFLTGLTVTAALCFAFPAIPLFFVPLGSLLGAVTAALLRRAFASDLERQAEMMRYLDDWRNRDLEVLDAREQTLRDGGDLAGADALRLDATDLAGQNPQQLYERYLAIGPPTRGDLLSRPPNGSGQVVERGGFGSSKRHLQLD